MKDSLMESLLLHLDAIEKLWFFEVRNLSPYMESLSNAINQRSNKIQLRLSNQRLNDDDVKYLAGCLGNISLFDMWETYISSDQCRVLKQAIQQLPSSRISIWKMQPVILWSGLNNTKDHPILNQTLWLLNEDLEENATFYNIMT
uniref:Uncharacterized protein n=1 Tax=Ciona intestinalis TaxID=7719 RepID=H2XL86_CIOIN